MVVVVVVYWYIGIFNLIFTAWIRPWIHTPYPQKTSCSGGPTDPRQALTRLRALLMAEEGVTAFEVTCSGRKTQAHMTFFMGKYVGKNGKNWENLIQSDKT
jgi:hypothetical protein